MQKIPPLLAGWFIFEYNILRCRCSSMAEQALRKRQVVGSTPTIGFKRLAGRERVLVLNPTFVLIIIQNMIR